MLNILEVVLWRRLSLLPNLENGLADSFSDAAWCPGSLEEDVFGRLLLLRSFVTGWTSSGAISDRRGVMNEFGSGFV